MKIKNSMIGFIVCLGALMFCAADHVHITHGATVALIIGAVLFGLDTL